MAKVIDGGAGWKRSWRTGPPPEMSVSDILTEYKRSGNSFAWMKDLMGVGVMVKLIRPTDTTILSSVKALFRGSAKTRPKTVPTLKINLLTASSLYHAHSEIPTFPDPLIGTVMGLATATQESGGRDAWYAGYTMLRNPSGSPGSALGVYQQTIAARKGAAEVPGVPSAWRSDPLTQALYQAGQLRGFAKGHMRYRHMWRSVYPNEILNAILNLRHAWATGYPTGKYWDGDEFQSAYNRTLVGISHSYPQVYDTLAALRNANLIIPRSLLATLVDYSLPVPPFEDPALKYVSPVSSSYKHDPIGDISGSSFPWPPELKALTSDGSVGSSSRFVAEWAILPPNVRAAVRDVIAVTPHLKWAVSSIVSSPSGQPRIGGNHGAKRAVDLVPLTSAGTVQRYAEDGSLVTTELPTNLPLLQDLQPLDAKFKELGVRLGVETDHLHIDNQAPSGTYVYPTSREGYANCDDSAITNLVPIENILRAYGRRVE